MIALVLALQLGQGPGAGGQGSAPPRDAANAEVLLATQFPAPGPWPPAPDSLPVVTLTEALRLAERLDPEYVAARGDVDYAEWSRRAAR